MILDSWQSEVLNASGNICVRSGRQCGKSTIISILAAEYSVMHPNKTVLVVAAVERQAYLLFDKIHTYLMEKYNGLIKTGKDKPTRHVINLKNKSRIYCLPLGLDARGVRGYTVDLLIVDECAYVPEACFNALTPMLAVTKGRIVVLSTPKGKDGYFYRCFTDDSFTKFHVSALDCPRRDDNFLKREKERLTKLAWAQEYLAEFIDELRQFFPSELIKKSMTLQQVSDKPSSFPAGDSFMGVDVARLGQDQSVLISVDRIDKEKLKMFDMTIIEQELTTVVTKKILQLDRKHNYKKIYIDIGGVGAAVFDPLLDESQTKSKVIPIDNAVRSLDKDDNKTRKLFKTDLYTNLLWLMEREKIELFDDPEIFLSLSSVLYEYNDKNELLIYGNYTHIAEALIRAAWCMKDKSLNIWCR